MIVTLPEPHIIFLPLVQLDLTARKDQRIAALNQRQNGLVLEIEKVFPGHSLQQGFQVIQDHNFLSGRLRLDSTKNQLWQFSKIMLLNIPGTGNSYMGLAR